MMTCGKCHDTNGPFIADVKSGECLCEDCYIFKEIVSKCAVLIKTKARTKDTISMTAVTLMDSIETAVFDELGIR